MNALFFNNRFNRPDKDNYSNGREWQNEKKKTVPNTN